MGLKDKVLGTFDRATKKVHVPEWDVTLTVCELGLEEGLLLAEMYGTGEKVSLTGRDIAQVVAWGVLDENGDRMFADEDVAGLSKKSRHALMRLFTEISQLSAAGAFEEAEKN